MAIEQATVLFRQLQALHDARHPTDRELLQRFVAQRDDEAVTALVRRHGPLVLRVGRSILGDMHAAEDVFQAAFLVLSRKAASLLGRDSAAAWLHGVAHRLALKARTAAARRQAHESRVPVKSSADSTDEMTLREAQEILVEELQGLPERNRASLLLCYWEGATRDEAARRLGWSLSTLKRRLERGRKALHDRLARRGLTLSVALTVPLLAEVAAAGALPPALVQTTVGVALQFVAGNAPRTPAVAWAQGMLQAMMAAKLKLGVVLMLLVGVAAASAGLVVDRVFAALPGTQQAEEPSKRLAKDPGKPRPAGEPALRTDRYGDSLPPGAIARIGTLRFRQLGNIGQIAFAADSKVLAAADSHDGICFWDVATGKELRRFDRATAGSGPSVAYSPDGKLLVAGMNHEIRRWDPATGAELSRFALQDAAARNLTFSPDGKVLACLGTDSRDNRNLVVFLDATSGAELHRLAGLQNYVAPSVAFAPDATLWAYADKKDNEIGLYEVRSGKRVRRLQGHGSAASTVAFAPDGQTLASTDGDGKLRFWDLATGQRLPLTGQLRATHNLTYSPDGKLLAGGGSGRRPELWDVAAGRLLERLEQQRNGIEAVAFSPDGKLLASATHQAVYLWDVTTGKAVLPFQGHDREIYAVTLSPDGKTLVSTGGEFGTVRRWETATGKELPSFDRLQDYVYGVAYAPDGKLLAAGTGNHNGTIWLLDPTTGKEVRKLVIPKGYVTSIAFSADGKTLASRAFGRVIHVWDVATGKEIHHFQGSPEGHTPIALSPDGKVIADGSATDSVVRLWEAATGRELRRLEGHAQAVLAVAFSPDGKLLASSGGDKAIRLWDLAAGKELRQLAVQAGWPRPIAFSSDGRMLVSGEVEAGVRLWEVATGKERCRFEGHRGGTTTAVFSADGRLVVTGGYDTTVLVWDMTGRLRAGGSEPANLTTRELENLWSALAGADAARAFQALQTLAAAPAPTVAFLKEHLRPARAADPQRTRQLLRDLDSDQFAVRERAAQELGKVAELAEPALRATLAGQPSEEVRRRVEALLGQLDPATSPERLRGLRAVEVLEHVGTPAARQVLEALAMGAPEALLTQDARWSLERLEKRQARGAQSSP